MENQIIEKESKKDSIKDILKFTIIALIIVIPFRMYIAQPFIVEGASMDPNFETGQYLIVDQVSYRVEDPKRDEVIVMRYPRDPKTFYIKRIIGLPGETVISEIGKISIKNSANPNGFPLDEKFVDFNNKSNDSFEITLGPTEYFVMGDNRARSSDSRTWGPLESKYIVGRPILRLLPVSKLSLFPGV